jgi:hypothetical protein
VIHDQALDLFAALARRFFTGWWCGRACWGKAPPLSHVSKTSKTSRTAFLGKVLQVSLILLMIWRGVLFLGARDLPLFTSA